MQNKDMITKIKWHRDETRFVRFTFTFLKNILLIVCSCFFSTFMSSGNSFYSFVATRNMISWKMQSCQYWHGFWNVWVITLIANFTGPTWGPPGSCRPQVGPVLAPWTLLYGYIFTHKTAWCDLWSMAFLTLHRGDGWVLASYRTSVCNNSPVP